MDKLDVKKDIIDEPVDLDQKNGFVIATLGRACKNPETLIKMIDSGMNIVRLRLCQEERKIQVIMLEYLKEAFTHKPHK